MTGTGTAEIDFGAHPGSNEAEQEAMYAQMLLAEAVEAERVAKQQIMDFDIAFVAAVLMES